MGVGVPPGRPQGLGVLWPLTICHRSSQPSQPPCAQRSPALRGGSAPAAPFLQLHCGGTAWGAVGRHCASQHGPSLNPPVLHMIPILPLPPHLPLSPSSPNPDLSNDSNPMPSSLYSCPLVPNPSPPTIPSPNLPHSQSPPCLLNR